MSGDHRSVVRASPWAIAAFAWGFAEATLFFIVPDVLLTFLAQRRGLKPALAAAVCAVSGACLGGLLMWRWGGLAPDMVRDILDRLPAVSRDMLGQAGPALSRDAFGALLAGAFSGVPYKVYAAAAPSAGLGWPELMLASVPARSARFLLLILLAAGADRLAGLWIGRRARVVLLLGGWALFYAVFWSTAPN